LYAQREGTQREIEKSDAAVKALRSVAISNGSAKRRKPKFTKAGLGRIAAAQRARWAKINAGKGEVGFRQTTSIAVD
jgi:hypothetical protein